MFRRSRGRKVAVSIPKRKWKTNRPDHREWDSTVSDLSVHRASEEEVQRRRLIHKSKNASAARRALGERAKRVFMDPASPAQVEMEMKKLAILKEVLYDHDDLNEVLKRVDNTMSSVKTMFHGAPFRTAGNLNVTMAPGAPGSGNSLLPASEEPTTQMSLLSESIMDKHALNEESTGSEDEGSEEQFESKVDYERFLNVLKESLNKSVVRPQSGPAGDATTPVNNGKPGLQQNQALNRTEEVKRTMARVESRNVNGHDQTNTEENPQAPPKKIDDTITRLITGNAGDNKKKNPTVSFSMTNESSGTLPPPRPNITAANMTYENLQEAMESVTANLSQLDDRRGNDGMSKAADISIKTDGLAGFTATLIDAVTRLTVYGNETEAKLLVMESKMAELKDQNDHQRALLDALTAELMSTQDQINDIKKTSSQEKEQMEKDHIEFKNTVQKEISDLKDLIAKLSSSETKQSGGRGVVHPTSQDLPTDPEKLLFGQESSTKEKEEREEALKSDMLSLLGALKSQNTKDQQEQTQSSNFVLPMNNATTKDAAQTVASVESQLRHLQLQHAEAQNRMQELTHVAGILAGQVADSQACRNPSDPTSSPGTASSATPSIVSGPLTPHVDENEFHALMPLHSNEAEDSLSTLTITSSMLPNIDTSRQSVQSNGLAKNRVPSLSSDRKIGSDVSSLKSSDRVCLSEDSFRELELRRIPALLMQQSNIFGISPQSENENHLSKDTPKTNSALPSFKATGLKQPENIENTQNITTSIKETQFNLEDRIADLNRQHAEAQARLQNLLKKRAGGFSPSSATSESSISSGSSAKMIQVTLPTEDMLKTPKVHKPPEPFRPMTLEEDSFM